MIHPEICNAEIYKSKREPRKYDGKMKYSFDGDTGGVPKQLLVGDRDATASTNMALLVGTSNANPFSSFQSLLAGFGYKSLLLNPTFIITFYRPEA